MKKRIETIIWILVLLLVLTTIIGLPYHAYRSAKRYMDDKVPENDFQSPGIGFVPWYTAFLVDFESPTNVDATFQVVTDLSGKILSDNYNAVTEGTTLKNRLNKEYKDLVGKTFFTEEFPYELDQFETRFNTTYPHDEQGVVFEPGKQYDTAALGASGGFITVTVYSTGFTPEKVLEALRWFHTKATETGVYFRQIILIIKFPGIEEGKYIQKPFNIRFDEIMSDELIGKIKENF